MRVRVSLGGLKAQGKLKRDEEWPSMFSLFNSISVVIVTPEHSAVVLTWLCYKTYPKVIYLLWRSKSIVNDLGLGIATELSKPFPFFPSFSLYNHNLGSNSSFWLEIGWFSVNCLYYIMLLGLDLILRNINFVLNQSLVCVDFTWLFTGIAGQSD